MLNWSEKLELGGWEPQDFDRMVRRLATDDEYYDMVIWGCGWQMSYWWQCFSGTHSSGRRGQVTTTLSRPGDTSCVTSWPPPTWTSLNAMRSLDLRCDLWLLTSDHQDLYYNDSKNNQYNANVSGFMYQNIDVLSCLSWVIPSRD